MPEMHYGVFTYHLSGQKCTMQDNAKRKRQLNHYWLVFTYSDVHSAIEQVKRNNSIKAKCIVGCSPVTFDAKHSLCGVHL